MKPFILKFFLFITLIVILAGCTSRIICEGWGPKLMYRDELSRVLVLFGEEMRSKKGWETLDMQVKYNDGINKIKILFQSLDVVELCEARKVLVDVVDQLLDRLNSNGFLLVDRQGQEFTYDDLDLTIKYVSFFELFVDPMYIGWISLNNGISSFFSTTFIAYDNPDDYWFKRREYFHQSRVIVYAQREAETKYFEPKKQTEGAFLLEEDLFKEEQLSN